jgi:hypothetical protein
MNEAADSIRSAGEGPRFGSATTERPYHSGCIRTFIIDTMPKHIVMLKLTISKGSHGWISSHIG